MRRFSTTVALVALVVREAHEGERVGGPETLRPHRLLRPASGLVETALWKVTQRSVGVFPADSERSILASRLREAH